VIAGHDGREPFAASDPLTLIDALLFLLSAAEEELDEDELPLRALLAITMASVLGQSQHEYAKVRGCVSDGLVSASRSGV
jgi:hypothetical protein